MISLKYISYNAYIKLLLITISISISYFLGYNNINLLLIGVMSISPVVILKHPYIHKIDLWVVFIILSIVIMLLIFNSKTIRWSTIIYSSMFCLTFMAYIRLLRHSTFTVEDYAKILRLLIYAYGIVLIIQQICVLVDIPIFNASNYRLYNKWKLNSLSPEPSHSAVYIGVLMYCYITTKEKITGVNYTLNKEYKLDKKLWLCFFWSMITMNSGTAILYVLIILAKLFNKKQLLLLTSIFILAISLYGLNYKPLTRVLKTSKSVLIFDTNNIIKADLSAAFRIVPSITAIKRLNISDKETWTGKGIDFMRSDLHNQLPGTTKDVASISTAFTMAIDYGIIFFILWCAFTFYTCVNRKEPISYILWFTGVLLNGINVQIVWFIILFLYTNNHINNYVEKDNACLRHSSRSN